MREIAGIFSLNYYIERISYLGRDLPAQPHPGRHHNFHINYHDKNLGVVPRHYIFQLPTGVE